MSTNAEILIKEARTIARDAGGIGAVDPARLVLELNRRQPQFADAIRLLGGALSLGAVERFKAAADIEAAIQTLSADLAILEAVPQSQAEIGCRLAAAVCGHAVPVSELAAEPGAEKPETSWLGTTDIGKESGHAEAPAGNSGEAISAIAAAIKDQIADIFKEKKPLSAYLRDYRVLAAIAILILIIGNLSNGASDQPHGAPPPPPSPPPAGNALPPMLANPAAGSLPRVAPVTDGQGTIYGFRIPSRDGKPLIGMLFLPDRGGWGRGTFEVVRPGIREPVALSAPAAFTLQKSADGAQRRLDIGQWQRNQTKTDSVCLIAASKGGDDVPLHGFDLCMLLQHCGQMLGCVAVN